MAETLGLILIQYGQGKLALVKRFSNVIGFILITIIQPQTTALAAFTLAVFASKLLTEG